MQFLTKQEFSKLSDSQKSDYYSDLNKVRLNANTVSEYETLIIEFEKLGYRDSIEIAEELRRIAERQLSAEKKARFNKALKIGRIALCGFFAVTLIVSAVMIARMF